MTFVNLRESMNAIKKRRIAVVGAGLTGLAVAWHLLESLPLCEIVIYDSHPFGGGASVVAAGLLHPYAGTHAKLNRMGHEGMQSAKKLLRVSEEALGSPVSNSSGLLRLALTEVQKEDYLQCAQKNPQEVSWLEAEECQALVPGVVAASGILIKDGITVHLPSYLKGLRQACAAKGAIFKQEKISSLRQLEGFTLKIIATGAATTEIDELTTLPIKPVRGQILELAWPHDLPPLKFPINSYAYLVMSPGNRSCLAGATFEKGISSSIPDIDFARAEIMPHVASMMPALASAEIINCQAGVRASSPQHLPLLEQIAQDTWVLAGMGSKGLLYHALMAEKLVNEVMSNE